MIQRVNIIGLGSGWDRAPTDELSWGVNTVNLFRPVDAVFNLHDLPGWFKNGLPARSTKTPKMLRKSIARAARTNTPFYSLDEYELEGIEGEKKYRLKCKKFPIKEIVDFFDEDFFTSSFDYIFAFAIFSGFKKINAWGINMTNGSEYLHQRLGAEYWRGVCKGFKIETHYNGKLCEIGKCPRAKVYGYEIDQKDFKETIAAN